MSGDDARTDTALFVAVVVGGAVFIVVTGFLLIIEEWVLHRDSFAAALIGFACSTVVMGVVAWRLDRR